MSSHILLLCYPEFSEEDANFIEAFRAEHDKKYATVVRPHFTIFFPIQGLDIDDFSNHVAEAVKDVDAFSFTIKYAALNKDDSNDDWYIFLVPDIGNSLVHKLHDRIYTGEYEQYHRLDLGYTPHIGIATNTDEKRLKFLCDALNEEHLSISGTITEVVIAEFNGLAVKDLKKIPL